MVYDLFILLFVFGDSLFHLDKYASGSIISFSIEADYQ